MFLCDFLINGSLTISIGGICCLDTTPFLNTFVFRWINQNKNYKLIGNKSYRNNTLELQQRNINFLINENNCSIKLEFPWSILESDQIIQKEFWFDCIVKLGDTLMSLSNPIYNRASFDDVTLLAKLRLIGNEELK